MTSSSKALRWTLVALRVILGAIFVYAGYLKLRDPWALFAMGIDSYHILPFRFVEPVARTLPAFEVIVGAVLISGFWQRTASSLISLMLVVFFSAIIHAR